MRCILFFVFKQKTAYEMRISDWSSDVCSSDLDQEIDPALRHPVGRAVVGERGGEAEPVAQGERADLDFGEQLRVTAHGGSSAFPGRRERVGCPEIGRESCRERVCQYV